MLLQKLLLDKKQLEERVREFVEQGASRVDRDELQQKVCNECAVSNFQ